MILNCGVVFESVLEVVVSVEMHDLWRAFSCLPRFPASWIARSSGCVCCCSGMDCLHEVVDYDVLLLVHDGHGHVTHGAARLVHGVLGARWLGQSMTVFSMVFTLSWITFAVCWYGSVVHCVGFGPAKKN